MLYVNAADETSKNSNIVKIILPSTEDCMGSGTFQSTEQIIKNEKRETNIQVMFINYIIQEKNNNNKVTMYELLDNFHKVQFNQNVLTMIYKMCKLTTNENNINTLIDEFNSKTQIIEKASWDTISLKDVKDINHMAHKIFKLLLPSHRIYITTECAISGYINASIKEYNFRIINLEFYSNKDFMPLVHKTLDNINEVNKINKTNNINKLKELELNENKCDNCQSCNNCKTKYAFYDFLNIPEEYTDEKVAKMFSLYWKKKINKAIEIAKEDTVVNEVLLEYLYKIKDLLKNNDQKGIVALEISCAESFEVEFTKNNNNCKDLYRCINAAKINITKLKEYIANFHNSTDLMEKYFLIREILEGLKYIYNMRVIGTEYKDKIFINNEELFTVTNDNSKKSGN